MIVLLLMMTAISASLRLIPFVFSRWLRKWSVLEKLAATLPQCITLLLVAHLLEKTPFTLYPFGIPELIGLVSVVIVQICFRNLLLSMGSGMLFHQLLLHYLTPDRFLTI
jgi:branched-subunit amino acid transport protein AzlD